jgi:L-iditol 2-dehydrogenase
MQDFIAHPASLLEIIPDKIDDDAAVVLEPLAIALHAIALAKVRPGQTVVVLGTGVIGTCVLSLLKLHEGTRVLCVDPLQDRLERALDMGADQVVRVEDGVDTADAVVSAIGGLGADVVFECAGVPDSLWNMCEIAAPGGHIAIIGSNPDDRVMFSSGSARRKGLTLRFVRRSLNTLPQCVDYAGKRLIAPGDLVTHVFGTSQVERAFETVGNYADGVLKALIDMET